MLSSLSIPRSYWPKPTGTAPYANSSSDSVLEENTPSFTFQKLIWEKDSVHPVAMKFWFLIPEFPPLPEKQWSHHPWKCPNAKQRWHCLL